MKRTFWPMVAAGWSVLGCVAGPADSRDKGVTETEDLTASAIEAPTIAQCWIEGGAQPENEALVCRVLEVDGLIPWRTLDLAVGAAGRGQVTTTTLTPALAGQDLVVATFRAGSFPLVVRTSLEIGTRNDVRAPHCGSGSNACRGAVEIRDRDGSTRENPVAISVPYDLWPIRILVRSDDRFSGAVQVLWGSGELVWTALPDGENGSDLQFYWPVPPGDRAPLNVDGRSWQIPGPGTYVFTDEGLRPATASDLPPPTPEVGPVIMRCWLERPACSDEGCPFKCSVSSGDGLFVDRAWITVQSRTGTWPVSEDFLNREGPYGRVTEEDFPVTVSIIGHATQFARGEGLGQFTKSWVVEDFASFPTSFDVRLPYEVVGVTIDAQHEVRLTLDEMTIERGADFDNQLPFTTRPEVSIERFDRRQLYFPMPAGMRRITGTVRLPYFDSRFPIELHDGSAYTITMEGVSEH